MIDDGGIEGNLTPNTPEIADCCKVSGGACKGDKLEPTSRSDTKQEVEKQAVWKTGSDNHWSEVDNMSNLTD